MRESKTEDFEEIEYGICLNCGEVRDYENMIRQICSACRQMELPFEPLYEK